MKKKISNSFGPSKKDRQYGKKLQDTVEMLRLMDEFKMLAFYVLRNQGWGKTRLLRFNEKWNAYMIDVSTGHFSIDDVKGVMLDELGLTAEDLMIQVPKGVK